MISETIHIGTQKLLTIAIPTYNRAAYLDTCLSHITLQLSGYETLVEVIVSDNCSSDNTSEVVSNYLEKGFNITYIRNESNLGADKNFVNCLVLATGKYALIFGDDDILLDGAIKKIIDTIMDQDFGVIYLNPFGFKISHYDEHPTTKKTGSTIYSDLNAYACRVNIMFTFISGIIFNKNNIINKIDPYKFINTNLIQLNWILSAMVSSQNNVYFEEHLVAGKEDNTGGYDLFKVFSVNINDIFKSFKELNENKSIINTINNELLLYFFPTYILNKKQKSVFNKEDIYTTLHGVFNKYLLFWIVIVPILKMPQIIALLWLKIIKGLIKIYRKIWSML